MDNPTRKNRRRGGKRKNKAARGREANDFKPDGKGNGQLAGSKSQDVDSERWGFTAVNLKLEKGPDSNAWRQEGGDRGWGAQNQDFGCNANGRNTSTSQWSNTSNKKNKRRGKGQGYQKLTPEEIERARKRNPRIFPETIGTLLDNSVIIPKLPVKYDVFRQNFNYPTPVPEPVLTDEKKRENVRNAMRANKLAVKGNLYFPVTLPVKVKLKEVTIRGTVVIEFVDPVSEATFDYYAKRCNAQYNIFKVFKSEKTFVLDKDDAELGLVVLAKLEGEGERNDVILGEITAFDDDNVTVAAGDTGQPLVVPYNRIFYCDANIFTGIPRKVQEFRLMGLEKYDLLVKWWVIEEIFRKAMKKENFAKEIARCGNGFEYKKEFPEHIKDIREYDFILSKAMTVGKGADSEIRIELLLPRQVAKDVSINYLADKLFKTDPFELYTVV